MNHSDISNIRRSLNTPQAAAFAGILFAILYGTSLILINISIPPESAVDGKWLESNGNTIGLALNLIPYAGIAFLWFIGVIRDRMGELEDKLFATVFLGSGLLFLALTFVGAVVAGALISSYSLLTTTIISGGFLTYSRAMTYQVFSIYANRMAGVFMMSLGTIWLRTGLMQRKWAYLTYILAFILLLTIGYSLWVLLIFPGWVFLVSVYILLKNVKLKRTFESNHS